MWGYIAGAAALLVLKNKKHAPDATLTRAAIVRAGAPGIHGFKLAGGSALPVKTTTGAGVSEPVNPLEGKVALPRVIVAGKRLTSWHQVWDLMQKTQKFRKATDKLSSSSSFSSLAGNAAISPLWKWDDEETFAGWWVRGGEKHITAAIARLKKTGGNESFWGAEGGFGDIIELGGNILGGILTGGLVTDAGTHIEGAYDASVTLAYNGDGGAFVDKLATNAKNLLSK